MLNATVTSSQSAAMGFTPANLLIHSSNGAVADFVLPDAKEQRF